MRNETGIVSETKADQAYKRIKAAILGGEAAPGDKLVVSQLARAFNTSIIPVREAVTRLEAEGLLTVVPHTGIYVKKIDAEGLKELYPVRSLLEGFAVRLAAPRLTEKDYARFFGMIDDMDRAIEAGDFSLMGQLNHEFHMAIYRISGNESLIRLIEDLWQKTITARIVFNLTPGRAVASNREHRKIIDAFSKSKISQAERLIIRQNEKTLEILLRDLAKARMIPSVK